jgi:hypothetical protein
MQHNVSALLSVPAWWKDMTFRVRTGWIKDDGQVASYDEYVTGKVSLPLDVSALHGAVLDISDPRSRRPERSSTSLDEGVNTFEVGGAASVIVWGINLFRASQLSLGAQVTEDVQVLPGMNGIVAKFSSVADPGGLDDGQSKPVEVRLWTSTGYLHVGQATIRKKPKEKEKPEVSTSKLSIALEPELYVTYEKDYDLKIKQGNPPSSLPANGVRVKHPDPKIGWLPLKGARLVMKEEEKVTLVSFTMQLVGQDNNEESRRTNLEEEPLTIGLFTKENDKEPTAISTSKPILMKKGKKDELPGCVMTTHPIDGSVRQIKVSFENTLLRKLGTDFPGVQFRLVSDKFSSNPVCEPGKLVCTANAKLKSNLTEIRDVTLLSSDEKRLGIEPFTCSASK